MKRAIAILLMAMALFSVVSCSAGETGVGIDGVYHGGLPAYVPDGRDVAYGESKSSSSGEKNGTAEEQQPLIPAGQLTAAEWNDLAHYEEWLAHFDRGQTPAEDGSFCQFAEKNNDVWQLPYADMKAVTVMQGETPVAGAKVRILSGEEAVYSAVTNAKGVAYLFTSLETGILQVVSGTYTAEQPFSGEAQTTVSLEGANAKQDVIELMFVIDTTGSMGDELRYIKAEVDDVIARVKTANEGVEVRLALLFYRDQGDEYVTRYFDFTTDIEAQRENLDQQASGGGGDYPEAVHKALTEAVAQQWSTGVTTKLLFHVLDAPPHDTKLIAETYRTAIFDAAEKGIRIIPVSSSGVDRETEFLLREEAMLTGGTYTFLTNDSGIGFSHLEPTVGKYTVELLNSLMVRLITQFHTGVEITPIDWRQEVGR